MIKSACKDCTVRHIGCHGKCSDYKQYRTKVDNAHTEKEKDYDIRKTERESIYRRQKAGGF